MKISGKILLLIVFVCYISTAYGRQKTIKDTVIDTVSASAKSGAKLATDTTKTAGDYVVDVAVSAAKVSQDVVASAAKVAKEYTVAGTEKDQEIFNEYVIPAAKVGIEIAQEAFKEYVVSTGVNGAEIVKGEILGATDILKQKVTKAAKVGSEYAEIFGEKVDTAAETGSEYLAQGTETVKEYATEYADELLKQSKVFKEIAKENLDEDATETIASAKQFAVDAVKTTGEHATQASESKAHTPGTVTVDSLTFDKILRNFDVVLAKFDDKYPHGDKHDQFKKFAENVANAKNLLVVEIPITDYGEKENEQLAKEYSVTKADFPAYKLFIKGKSKPIDYTGDSTEEDLKRFLSQNTDLWFGLSGTLESLDRISREFFDASSANDAKTQNSLVEKAREVVQGLTDKKEQKSGESYIKIMEAAVKQGVEFFKREERRVQNLLKGKITTEKRVELQNRANILLSFKTVKETGTVDKEL
ncbi:unnamed protein product [Rotaria socialis]|uniref:Uncharacterized protein n=1 Tax=Rotaria socialis TaxID=392032 RepID=A0A817RCP5_9BILA|nr:unnamed protein product [Rotaria socialis]CAF3249944.1 unnamed protein product [Rotaria socialis]CAF4115895.1 unnamed protein product [Rotaria socialis]CAF4136081.1 unnamed protein product [Rotaria socialis]